MGRELQWDNLPPMAQMQQAADHYFNLLFPQYQIQFTQIPGGQPYRWYKDAFTHAFTSAWIAYNYSSAIAGMLGTQRKG